MHAKLMKMLGKKRDLSENEKSAKIDVMKELRDDAAHAMHGKLDGLKKVSVMSDDPSGLSEGLDKAKELISGEDKYSEGGEVESDEEENEQLHDAESPGSDIPSSDSELAEDDDMSEEELDQKLEHLMKLKEKMAKK